MFGNKHFSPCSALSQFITALVHNVKCLRMYLLCILVMHANNLKGAIGTRNALSII